MDFHQTLYAHYAPGGHPIAVFSDLIKSLITIWWTRELVRRKQH